MKARLRSFRLMEPDSTGAPQNSEPNSLGASVVDDLPLLVSSVKTLVELHKANSVEQERRITAVIERVEEAFKATDETLQLLRTTLDVMQQFLANLDGQIEKLGQTTVALIQVQNNLIELMTAPDDQGQDSGDQE